MCKDENLTIPLLLKGVISYFNVTMPSLYEIENCQHIALTATEEWNPYARDFEEREDQVQSSKDIKAFSVYCLEHNDIMIAGIYFEERTSHIKQIASSTMIKKALFVCSRARVSHQVGKRVKRC
jgi:hypothetical protein